MPFSGRQELTGAKFSPAAGRRPNLDNGYTAGRVYIADSYSFWNFQRIRNNGEEV
jgi:hypothetical protein